MGYVALSRVRSLEGLNLLGINRMALRVSDEAIRIDEQLRKKACDDHARFEHLRAKALKRAKAAIKKPPRKKPRPVAGRNGWRGCAKNTPMPTDRGRARTMTN